MILRTVLTVTLSGLAMQAAAQDAPAPIEPEILTVEETIPEGPNLFALDGSWNGASNVYILGLDDLAMKGNLSPGLQANMVLTADGSTLYTSSNYNTRIVYGPTTSVIHEFDVATASITREIEVPAKLAMVEPQPGLLTLSADERYLLAMNATPATSVTVVDLEAGAVIAEIPTPGCWLILPAVDGPKFTTVCGDGTLASYTWAEDGTFSEPARSEVIFDPDADALFTNPARMGSTLVFASFTGNLYVVDDSADVPVLSETIAMTDGIDGEWAPAGSEVIVGHEASGTVYVLMHPDAYEGSHKDPSTEIWAYDLTNDALLYRSNSNGDFSLMLAQTEVPMLYGTDGASVFQYEIDPTARYAARLVNTYADVGSIGLMVTDQ